MVASSPSMLAAVAKRTVWPSMTARWAILAAMVDLPTPLGADQDDVGGLFEEVEGHEVLDGHAVAAAGPRPVEVGERLELSEAGLGEAALEGCGCAARLLPSR